MADVIVIGDGPGGLSAALFLAKNGLDVLVFGEDETAMHAAKLYNYLGLPEIGGTELQRIARQQVQDHGANLVHGRVTSVSNAEGGFRVVVGDQEHTARYLVLSEGKTPKIAPTLGVAVGKRGVQTDRNGLTSVERVYAVGRMVRPGRSQAIISAGDGAAAALDILAREKGMTAFADWDVPE